MEEKKVIKISLSTFFLILAIIVIIMGVFIYKLYNEKSIDTKKTTELQAKVDNLNGTLSELQEKNNNISNTIYSNNTSIENITTSNITSDNKTTKDTSKIVLEGNYIFENSDVGYEFNKNGNVSILGNVSETKGTYTTTGENEITITLKEESVTDIDTGKTTSTTINRTETIKVVDENTLLLNNTDGKNQKLVKYTNN